MTPPRLAVIGLGKMGQAVRLLAVERGWKVAAEVDSVRSRGGAGITRQALGGAEVAIEFTAPESAPANLIACARAGVPVVCGTTGWDGDRARVEREVLAAGGALLAAPNFSLGMVVFLGAAERLVRLAAGAVGFDAHIVETHHAAKRDAPSGTGKLIAERAGRALGRDIPITSVRVGAVPGTHALIVDGPSEQLRLVHEVRDRRVFAEGALTAAEWLVGRTGIWTLLDVLEPGGSR